MLGAVGLVAAIALRAVREPARRGAATDSRAPGPPAPAAPAPPSPSWRRKRRAGWSAGASSCSRSSAARCFVYGASSGAARRDLAGRGARLRLRERRPLRRDRRGLRRPHSAILRGAPSATVARGGGRERPPLQPDPDDPLRHSFRRRLLPAAAGHAALPPSAGSSPPPALRLLRPALRAPCRSFPRPHLRGSTLIAFALLAVNLLGVGPGPLVTGLVGDAHGLTAGLLSSFAIAAVAVLPIALALRRPRSATEAPRS